MKAIFKNPVSLIAMLGLCLFISMQLPDQKDVLHAGNYSALFQSGRESIVLFSAPDCSYCNRAKGFLAANGIAYREINVRTPEGKAQFQPYIGNGVIPVLMTATLRLSGYNETRYPEHVLPLAQAPSGGWFATAGSFGVTAATADDGELTVAVRKS